MFFRFVVIAAAVISCCYGVSVYDYFTGDGITEVTVKCS